MAMPRSDGSAKVTSRPSIRMSPPLTVSSPAIIRSSVDLPEPEAPTKTTNSPFSMLRSTFSMTRTGPNDLLTFLSSTAATLACRARATGPVHHRMSLH